MITILILTRVFKGCFTGSIQLDIDNSNSSTCKHKKIITDHLFNVNKESAVYIRKLPQIRLGTSENTAFGDMDIYLVLTHS